MSRETSESSSVQGGQTLEELLRSGTPLEPAKIARMGVELGRALESAYAAGRRTSGITTREIVLATDGRLALASSGAEPRLAGEEQSSADEAALYAAPETLRGEQGTQQSDVYSTGVVLYRLLTGAFPVSAVEVEEGQHVEAWNAREDLRGAGPRVPLRLAQIVERAIDPRPAARYATLDSLCSDLQEAARELRASNGLLPRRIRQGAALLVVLAIGALAWVVAHAPPDRPVVAVRFRHQGVSIEAREIVDGMTIEMTRLLAQVEGLEARAALPSSSAPRDAVAFGSQRRAEFVVSGLVHGETGAWRDVEASLIRVRDGQAVWSKSFAFVKGDIIAVQEQIAEAVANGLHLSFLPGRHRYSTTPPLQELFLNARALQMTEADAGRRATEMFEGIANADPEFVPASAALATALGGVRSSYDLPALDTRMAAAARRAHAKNPRLAEANAAMGLLSARLCQWSEGAGYFRDSLKQDPSVARTYIDYAFSILLAVGDTREALAVLAAALDADPMSLRVRSALARMLVEHGDFDRAIEMSRGVIQEAPELAAEQTLGRALLLSGRSREIGVEFGKGDTQWGYRGYMHAIQGRHADAIQLAKAHPDEPARQMLIYAGLNDVDRAFDAFQSTAMQDPWRALTWVARPEVTRVLRDDPRTAALRDQLLRPGSCAGSPSTAAALLPF